MYNIRVYMFIYILGGMYDRGGEGVEMNSERAFGYYIMASEHDHMEAMIKGIDYCWKQVEDKQFKFLYQGRLGVVDAV
jgi:TPR repeat protein